METVQRETSEKEVNCLLYKFQNLLAWTFEYADVLKFDYDPIRNRLFMECKKKGEKPALLLLKGIFKAEFFTKGSFDDTDLVSDLMDVGSVEHACFPKGHLNPPHFFFTIAAFAEYRFWCKSIVVNGKEFEVSNLRLTPIDRKKLGVPDDWQPPTENPQREK